MLLLMLEVHNGLAYGIVFIMISFIQIFNLFKHILKEMGSENLGWTVLRLLRQLKLKFIVQVYSHGVYTPLVCFNVSWCRCLKAMMFCYINWYRCLIKAMVFTMQAGVVC